MLLSTTVLLAVAANAFGPSPTGKVMPAFVQHAARQSYEAKFAQPQLGDLHKLYSKLPSPCEVQIKVMASSVNPSDKYPNIAASLKIRGHVLGSDVAGTVVAIGEQCTKLKVGDKVWGDIGANTLTSSGEKTKELGGFGGLAVALESQLWTMPAGMSFAEAGSLPKVALTSIKALEWYGGAKNGSFWKPNPAVMVLGGSGGTGTTGIQLARAFGARDTLITTTSSDNFDYCKGLGATRTIDYKAVNWWDAGVIDDNSLDVIYDTVGQQGTGDRAMAKLKTGGFYVTIAGALASKVKPGVTQNMFINSDTNLDSSALLKQLTDLSEAGHLRMPSIQQKYTLDKVAEAFAESSTGTVKGKLVIDVENSTTY